MQIGVGSKASGVFASRCNSESYKAAASSEWTEPLTAGNLQQLFRTLATVLCKRTKAAIHFRMAWKYFKCTSKDCGIVVRDAMKLERVLVEIHNGKLDERVQRSGLSDGAGVDQIACVRV